MTDASTPSGLTLGGLEERLESTPLDGEALLRFGRHLVLPEVGLEGQRRLAAARVLLIGVGGLGSPAALYLAAAGVGTLGLVEDDVVDRTNLQRQILYADEDVGRPKIEVAARRLRALHPQVNVIEHAERLSAANALELITAYDLVVDGSDNFPTRYLVNDACLLAGRPDVWGAVLRFDGQVSVFATDDGPCYRCLFPEPPPPGSVPSCAEGGVLGVLPGVVGALQATEAIKLILGQGESLIGRFLTFDALRLRFRELRLERDSTCPACAPAARSWLTDTIAASAKSATEAPCCATPNSQPIAAHRTRSDEPTSAEAPTLSNEPTPDATDHPMTTSAPLEISVETLRTWLDGEEPPVLVDVRETHELAVARIEGTVHIPLGELPARVEELPNDRSLVVHCHHGGRSAQAVAILRARGRERSTNLAGGIDAWSLQIDPSVPRY
ncbi:MAG: molybdopterin-synthase adenylyltransferase MoeB [Acidobacteriota bacterium]